MGAMLKAIRKEKTDPRDNISWEGVQQTARGKVFPSALQVAINDARVLKELARAAPPPPPPNELSDPIGTLLLKLEGANGAYNPLFNAEIYREDMPSDGFVAGQNVVAHEREHKRQFNNPGDYFSEEAIQAVKKVPGVNTLNEQGYSDRDLPMELMAHMVGSNASDAGFSGQKQSPHPAWAGIPDEVKLLILKNQQANLTDQDYLGNLDRYGSTAASAIERIKHLGANVGAVVRDTVGKIK